MSQRSETKTMNINPYERSSPLLVDAYRRGSGPNGNRAVCRRSFNRGLTKVQAERFEAPDSKLTVTWIAACVIFVLGLLPFGACVVMTVAYYMSTRADGGTGDPSLLSPWIVFPALAGGIVIGGGLACLDDYREFKAWAETNNAAWDEHGSSLVCLDNLPGNRARAVERLSHTAAMACWALTIADPSLRNAPEWSRLLEAARTAIAGYIDAPVPSKDGAAMVAAAHLADRGVRRAAKIHLAAVQAEKDALTAATDAVMACSDFADLVRREVEDRRLISLANA
jgi:hypothetical protein